MNTDEHTLTDSESYITHIRISEDAAHPSSPPPPESPPENKKPRVIVVAVKKSGRVRMHKARENPNGTFSIGKSWVLDDLSTIQSFTVASDTRQQQWAGESGFMVTIQKPYFWQAVTAKEKDFFIGSLIKIYRKYTGGKLPALIGFTDLELSEYAATPGQRPQTPAARLPSEPLPSNPPSATYPPTPPRAPNREPTHDLRSPSSNDSSTPRDGNGQTSAPTPSQFPASDFIRNLKPPDSRTLLQPFRPDSPAINSQRDNNSSPPSPQDSRSLRSLGGAPSVESFQNRGGSRDGPPSGPLPNFDRFRANGSYSPVGRTETPPQVAPRSPERSIPNSLRAGHAAPSQSRQDQLPERRRPPIPILSNKNGSPPESPGEFSTPPEVLFPSAPDGRLPRNTLEGQNGVQEQIVESYFPNGPQQPATSSDPDKRNVSDNTEGIVASPTNIANLPNVLSQLSSPGTPMTPTSPAPEEVHRPGLGPMIKKKSTKEIASAFRKAALAHNAFKPRAGGAVERIKDETVKTPNTPDGINGVFPAPSLVRAEVTQDGLKSLAPPPVLAGGLLSPEPGRNVPDVTITPSPGPVPASLENADMGVSKRSSPSPERKVPSVSSTQEERRRKRRSNHSAKYAKALGIDHSLLEGRTIDIESALMDYGWGDGEVIKTTYDDLQNAVKRDLHKVETGSWLGSFEHTDDRVGIVSNMLDKAIAECEELDGLLTLYNVELGVCNIVYFYWRVANMEQTLSEDVAYIEAQSQGLQVQTANQRLLHSELQTLLDTITISSSQLQVLKDASLTTSKGVQDVELALIALYRAIITIDPKIRQTGIRLTADENHLKLDAGADADRVGNEIASMRAVQEKKDRYRIESVDFIQRFKQYMSAKFREAEAETSNAIERNRNGNLLTSVSKLDLRRRDKPRSYLWIYSPLMLFAREIDLFEWEELLRMYETTAKKPYQEEFKDAISAWKRLARKSAGEEQDYLFTTQEKESDNIVARKLTVKRTKTIREGSRNSSGEKSQDGKITGFEAFAGALYDISQAIFMEQNFVVDLFHLSSLENAEFPDVVTASPPETRSGSNLIDRKPFDPDRTMAKRVQNTMEDMYSFWPAELQNLVDWVVKQDVL